MFKKIPIFSLLLAFIVMFNVGFLFAQTTTQDNTNLQAANVAAEAASNESNSLLTPQFQNPSYLWVAELAIPIIALMLIIIFLKNSIKAGSLTLGALIFISSTTMFWQEFFADWGAYLLYNPKFALLPWGHTMWATPNKPWFLLFSYGPYFVGIYMLMLYFHDTVYKKFPKLGKFGIAIVVGLPLFYLFNLIIEGASIYFGWWSYVQYIGPALLLKGGNYPLLNPVIHFSFYGIITLWTLSLHDQNGRVKFESLFKVDKFKAGLGKELYRVFVWIIAMNVLFWFCFTILTIIGRSIFGEPSTLVP